MSKEKPKTFTLLISAEEKEITIELPLPKNVLDSGPKNIEIKRNFKIELAENAGGPATLQVTKIGPVFNGMKIIVLKCTGIEKIDNKHVFVCKKTT